MAITYDWLIGLSKAKRLFLSVASMLRCLTTMRDTAANPTPPPIPPILPEHARVRLRRALPAAGLTVGASGTIVHVYEDGAGYEVEFTEGRKHPAVETLFPADIEELTEKDE